MEQTLRPNGERAQAAIAMLWVMLVLEIMNIAASALELNVLNRLVRGEDVDEATITSIDLVVGLMALLYLAGLITCAVLFIRWFRRAYFNLHLVAQNLENIEGWASGAWFVPFLNLVKPYQIMRELYTRTIKLVNSPITDTSFIGWWWGLWVINNIIGNVSGRLGMSADDLSEMVLSAEFSIAEGIFAIPAAILAVVVVKRYAAMEQVLAALPRTTEPGAAELKPL